MSQKIAGITGAGQDASYLAKLLLEKDYKVIIITRRSGSSDHWRFKTLGILDHKNLKFEFCDLTEFHTLCNIVRDYKFDELYNLAAQSFVQSSFTQPFTTTNSNYIGHLNVLEAVKQYSKDTKVYFASTSEMYGKVQAIPQDEKTPFYPRSPYGVSKLAGYWLGVNYRESYNMFVSNGILFNHESPLRGEEFVTRKITKKVAEIKYAKDYSFSITPLVLGNIEALRDWGFAGDYVEAMWLMLQQDISDDFVVATGKCYSIRDFVTLAFDHVGINLNWKGKGVDEIAIDNDGNVVLEISKEFYRPAEVEILQGYPKKAKDILGWGPKYNIHKLVGEMMKYDMGIVAQHGITLNKD